MTSFATKPAPGAWAERANCAGVDPDLFFPEKNNGHSITPGARVVCDGCEVKAECLAYAMSPPYEVHGVWAGTTARERRRMRTQQRLRGAS